MIVNITYFMTGTNKKFKIQYNIIFVQNLSLNCFKTLMRSHCIILRKTFESIKELFKKSTSGGFLVVE